MEGNKKCAGAVKRSTPVPHKEMNIRCDDFITLIKELQELGYTLQEIRDAVERMIEKERDKHGSVI